MINPFHAVLPPHLMFGKDFITLCGVVDGDPFPFKVSLHRDADVADLKEVIKETIALRDLNPFHLVVWMVRVFCRLMQTFWLTHCITDSFIIVKLTKAEPVEPEDTLLQRIRSRGNVGEFAKRLTSTQKMSTLFRKSPIKDHVYILVQLPSTNVSAPLNASPRTDTVTALYERLKQYTFVQVRGTPASGKTVLAQLLAEHIYKQDPDVHVIWIDGWPAEEVQYRTYLRNQGWKPHQKTVFIFDEAQLTYDDLSLWVGFFKSMHDFKGRRAIIFASYGSPASYLWMRGIPMVIIDAQRVTLDSIDHKDGLAPVGLLFTKKEFDDLVTRQYPSSEFYFDTSFFNGVFDITNGHIGAIQDFISIIIADDSYCKLKYTESDSQRYTWNSFLAEVSPRELLKKLANSASIFTKGLPSDKQLQVPATAAIFSGVLRGNVVKDADFTADDERTALQDCFKNGWLHTDKPRMTEDATATEYVFPSSLHRWYVEWKLWDALPPMDFQVDSLLDFVIDVIHLFSPRHFSAERRIGPGSIQRPPETEYQDEFYRCCHVRSNGSLITFPEYGTANGRVDFYVPAKSWGIELLRNGDQLASHCGRFSKAGSHMTTLSFSDYVIINCSTTHPKEEHPHMPKLYHVVFAENFQSVHILDNRLQVIKEFQLLMSL